MKTKFFIPLLVTVGSFAISGVSQAATTLALWTFETSVPLLNNSQSITGIAAESGSGTASGFHTRATTDWSNPAGNGSIESFSVNEWTTGDYFQFQVSSVGYEDLTVSFDSVRSGTGPASFKIQYSIDGSSFTDFATYTVLENTTPNNWTSGTPIGTTSFAFDFSSISALDDDSSIFFRLTSTVTPTNVAGTARIDNVLIAGTEIVAIPEPSRALLLGIGGLGLIFRRRRQ
jgi:hypothetical protein